METRCSGTAGRLDGVAEQRLHGAHGDVAVETLVDLDGAAVTGDVGRSHDLARRLRSSCSQSCRAVSPTREVSAAVRVPFGQWAIQPLYE